MTKFVYKRSWTYLPKVFPYVRRHLRLALVSVTLLIFAALISVLEPWPLGLLVDSVLGKRPLPRPLAGMFGSSRTSILIFAVAIGWGIALVGGGIAVFTEYVNTKLEQRLALDFRSDLFEHAQRLSLSFHEDFPQGNLIGRLIAEVHSMGSVPVALPQVGQSVLTLVAMFWIAHHLDAELAFLSLTVMPFIYLSIGYYANHIEPQVRKVKWLEWRAISMILEAIAMVRVVFTFGRERYEWRRFHDQGEQAVSARINVTVRQALFSLAVNGATATGTALVLGVGAYHVLQGKLTVGQLLVVMAYIASVYKPLEAISSAFSVMQDDVINLQLAFEYLEHEPEIKDRPGAQAIERSRGDVTFDAVDFSYHSREDTLKDISFEATAGQVIAIVGPTGAGKSTLVSLIPRLYEVEGGRVLLDGIDIRDLTIRSLRQQVGIVLQDPLLFTANVEENIRYGRLDASMDDIVRAAKAANAHDFIMALPWRYKTKLGEHGVKLSGGERQRICVARAFLRDAPVLILDEPTSSVDSKTEGVILDALDRLMVGRTTFIIAHRLSTVRRADRILVLDHGRLVQMGSEEELLERGGVYRQLYEAQLGPSVGANGGLPPNGGGASAAPGRKTAGGKTPGGKTAGGKTATRSGTKRGRSRREPPE
jgi:ATP-binding cassette, subfamily B, bacterial